MVVARSPLRLSWRRRPRFGPRRGIEGHKAARMQGQQCTWRPQRGIQEPNAAFSAACNQTAFNIESLSGATQAGGCCSCPATTSLHQELPLMGGPNKSCEPRRGLPAKEWKGCICIASMGARVASPGWGHACVDNLGPWQRFAPAFSEATCVFGRETARSPAERGVRRDKGAPAKRGAPAVGTVKEPEMTACSRATFNCPRRRLARLE